MEMVDGVLRVETFLTVTLGITVLFVGKRLNDAVPFLRELSIPEPVTGGLLFSVVFGIVYAASGVVVEFNLTARDILLVYFFTTIGINATFKDLLAGGKPFVVLLVIAIAYMVVQNLTGISVAAPFDLPTPVGLLGGTVSLIGGHGTAIAWAPRIAEDFGISNAMEIGIACATFGLILASLMGGLSPSFSSPVINSFRTMRRHRTWAWPMKIARWVSDRWTSSTRSSPYISAASSDYS
jgi:ESS family glutamate:Na+ symporter